MRGNMHGIMMRNLPNRQDGEAGVIHSEVAGRNVVNPIKTN